MRINKKRFTKSILFLTAVIFGISVLFNIAFGKSESNERAFDSVVVRSGDTLWSIAGEYTENRDIRKTMNEIVKFNNLETTSLKVNQIIRVPLD